MTEVTISTQTPLRPVSKTGLENLATTAKANSNTIKSLKVKTVCEGQFRNLNYVRDLPEHVIDEPLCGNSCQCDRAWHYSDQAGTRTRRRH